MFKIMTVILSLLVAEPAIADTFVSIAEPEVADPIELVPLYPATLEGDEALCGPDDPVDEDGHCAEYYRVKAETERLTEELSTDSDYANVGCNASVTENKATLSFLYLMSIALLAMKLKRKRRIFLDQK